MDSMYGNTLIFRTLRTGFPNASVTIVDNSSLPAARLNISELAQRHDCKYLQLPERVYHWQFIQRVIETASGGVVLLDPDVCLWENLEGLDIGSCLYGGRYIPRFCDEFTKTLTHARIHPSFVWIPDCERLRDAIAKLKQEYYCFEPYRHWMYCDHDSGEWNFHDTLSQIYHAIREKVYIFQEKELNCYDHIFQGSGPYLSLVLGAINNDHEREFLRKTHELAKGPDYKELKGIWREQEKYFRRRSVVDRGYPFQTNNPLEIANSL